jgi:CSLREA domain-containing protein
MHKSLTSRLFTSITLLILVASVRAGTVTVTNTNDALSGSLRQAIQDANPDDSIVFDIPTSDPGYDALTKVYTINLTSAGLTIGKDLILSGVGARVVVRRNISSSFSVFTVNSGAFVTIDSLTIANGFTSTNGGGIYNNGDLALSNCTLSGNEASNAGGGLYNAMNATIRNCTFASNEAVKGGAIFDFGTLILSDSTVSGNTSSLEAGGIETASITPTAHLRNTIVASNASGTGSPDVFGPFISDGYNFIGNATGSTGFGNSGSHDQVGTTAKPADPNLGPLLDHGGYTATMAPLLGSLVIDQGKTEIEPVDLDQRGVSRPTDQAGVVNAVDGDGSDIGAVELEEYQPGPNFTVDSPEDRDSGVCKNFGCSFREALNAANTSADANTITFAPELTDITITSALTATGLIITQPVTINGPGARLLTISGGDTNRCLQATGGTVVINGLSFAHGSSGSTPGGAIQNTNGATLTLNDCTFSQNNNVVTYGGAVAQLGAGVLNVNRCTFADNNGGIGGGLGNFEGTVVVTNSTFTQNSAQNGGAIASSSLVNPASLDLRSSTVVGNDATTLLGNGGGVRQSGGTFTVTNSIIAGNTSEGSAPNVSGTFVSQGSNVIGGAAGATGFTNGANGDQVGVADPKVGALANHGGLTDTMALLAGSAAINQANAATAPERDQRGYVRSDGPDVGAFEFGGTIPVTLANISTRLNVGTGDNVLIGGFIVTGTEDKKIIVRAIGPSLPLTGKLANPTLELYDASGLIVSNDNWKDTQRAEIQVTNIPPPNDLESAIVATLPANNSAYTAIVRGANNTTGVGLVEVYDLDRTVDSKLANISTRGLVQTGDNVMIGGLIVLGADPQDVIIRAIGPSLPLAGKLADPTLELHDSNGALVVSNDNWRSDQEAEILATGIPPSKDLESAIVRTLPPASYTAIVRGVANTSGIALVEVYALTP